MDTLLTPSAALRADTPVVARLPALWRVLLAWLAATGLDDDQRYLAAATDAADLERRQRRLAQHGLPGCDAMTGLG